MVPLSADRRAGLSGPPSTAGSVPATAESLQADLREMYRPDQEPVAAYLTRLSRIVLALRAHGVAISSAELDGLAARSWRRSSARSVATGIRPRWCGACGPGSRPQRLGKGTTATTATSRRRFRPLVSSSLPSAASRALAPIRFGAPLPTSRRKLLVLRRRFP